MGKTPKRFLIRTEKRVRKAVGKAVVLEVGCGPNVRTMRYAVRKRRILAHVFHAKADHFTKTGSGQTSREGISNKNACGAGLESANDAVRRRRGGGHVHTGEPR
jgi:hypothetical protein